MNLLNAILIIGFYQTLILGGLLLSKKNRCRSDIFLAALFLVFGITLLLGYLEIYNRENGYPWPFIISTSSPFILLHGPALWFYIKSITSQHFRFKIKYLLHLGPFLLVAILLFINTYRLSTGQRILIDSTEAFVNTFSFPFIIALIAASTQGYFIWGLIMIKRYKRRIKNYFSEISLHDLTWLKTLIIFSIVFYAGNSILYSLDYFTDILPYHKLQIIGYSYASVFVLVLGYRGYKQGNVFTSGTIRINLDNEEKKQKTDVPATDKDKPIVDQLLLMMEKEKPFLNPDLTLSDLAVRIKISPDLLSSVLNNKLNRNFFDFVNHYRVMEFKRICHEQMQSNITIMGMAWDAGFNSKATFNRVFKKTTGLTPGEYMAKTK